MGAISPSAALDTLDVLVIANALLLIADHMPFAGAAHNPRFLVNLVRWLAAAADRE